MTTILVVDDNALDRKLMGKSVEAAGWSVEFAENGRQAFEKIGQKVPDLVLTDLQMPEMDGLELVRQTKARFPATPVVLVTAYGSEELAVAALQAGTVELYSEAESPSRSAAHAGNCPGRRRVAT